MSESNQWLSEKLQAIKAIVLDVDGVLTDGSIVYGDDGSELKQFHVRDGLGIRLLLEEGIRVCVVTGRSSPALNRRCAELGIEHLYSGVKDKGAAMARLQRRLQVHPEAVACMGDDLPDIAMMTLSGLAVAVCDAHEEVKRIADVVTRLPGGKGAVREISERILQCRNRWNAVVARFREGK